MSQLPTSRLSNRMLPIPRQGVVESLNAPGITPLPPVSKGAIMANQFLAGMQAVGNVAGNIGGIFQQQAQERKQEQRDIDQEYRGGAELAARTRIAEMQQEVADGKYDMLIPPTKDGKVEDLVTAYLDGATKGTPDAYRNQYIQSVQPWLTAAVSQRRQGIVETAKRDQLMYGAEDIASASTAEQVDAKFSELRAKFPDMNENEFISATLLPALTAAAKSGDTDKFDAVRAVLGDRFPAQQADAEAIIKSRHDREDLQIEQSFVQTTTASRMNGTPTEVLKPKIADAMSKGLIRPTTAAGLLDDIEHQEQSKTTAIQNQNIENLRTEVLLGTRTPEQMHEHIIERVQLPPDNPFHIPATTARELINQVDTKTKADDSMTRVVDRERGGPAILTSSDDRAIMARMAQPLYADPAGKPQPLIDATGNVTNPELAATYIGRLDHIPGPIMDRINAAASSDNAADIANAAQLYHSLERIAPGALAKATGLNDTAKMRLSAISAGLDQNSPPSRLQDGSLNPAYVQRVQAETNKARLINAALLNNVDPSAVMQQMTGAARPYQVDAKLHDLLREQLPAWQQSRTRSLLGFDWLAPDKAVDLGDVPPTFLADFKDKAYKYFVGLTAAGYGTESAKAQASKQAFDDLRPAYIFANHNDRLYILPRYDNPQGAIDWTSSATDDWSQDFATLQRDGAIPKDYSFDDWRPITRKGALGILFANIDDPLNVLTGTDGNPIRFRPRTMNEIADEAQAVQEERAQGQAMADTARSRQRQLRLMDFVVTNRAKRDAGQSYDGRLNLIDKKISDANVAWFYANKADYIPPAIITPIVRPPHPLPGQSTTPEKYRNIKPEIPPFVTIPNVATHNRAERIANMIHAETGR